MKSAPSQREVKMLFSLVIPRGTKKLIAQGMGVSEADISRRFNPDDDRKLATAEGLLEQFHVIKTSPEQWLAIREYIESLWDEWQTRGTLPVPSAAQVVKEQSDYIEAELRESSPPRKGIALARTIAISKRRLVHLESGALRKVG